MDKEVYVDESVIEEIHLKIKKIKKLTNKNRILSLLRIAGITTSLYIDVLCFLSIFGEIFGLESDYPFVVIAFILFETHRGKRHFVQHIPKDQKDNYKMMDELLKEITDTIENEINRVERVK